MKKHFPKLKDGYIMSSSRGSSGEMSWSKCSRQTLEDLLRYGHSLECIFDGPPQSITDGSDEFDGLPGLTVSPDEQCRVFLKAFTALAVDNNGPDRCQVLLSNGSKLRASTQFQDSGWD